MVYLLLLLLCFQLNADSVLLVPDCQMRMNDKDHPFFRYSPNRPAASIWQKLDQILQSRGLGFRLSDLSEYCIGDTLVSSTSDVKKILFLNIPTWIPNWEEKLRCISKNKLILLAFEPPSVMQEMYSRSVLNMFGQVLSWNTNIIDNQKIFKFHYPVLTSYQQDIPPFHQRKLLTQIFANKSSPHPNELYSERRKVIDYFERKQSNDFEFYGYGWQGQNLKNYKGAIEDKITILKKYRFTIAYENMKGINGYVTEKIFDCFAAGSVPIYLGASDITKYVPKSCFIARNDFSSFDALYTYIKNMGIQEYRQYLKNIREFLKSDKAGKFSKESFVWAMMNRIDAH